MLDIIMGMLLVVIAYYVIKFLFNHLDFRDHDDNGPGGFTGNPFV